MIHVLNEKSLASSNNSRFNISEIFPLGSSDEQGQYTFVHDPDLKFKKRIRSVKFKRKANSKQWIPKDLKDDWLDLAKKPQWKTLTKDKQRRLQLFWPSRHCCLSYEEIATTLNISRKQAIRFMDKLVKLGVVKKEYKFLKRRGKTTKIHKRNYYVLTEKGRAKLDEIVAEFYPKKTSKMSPRKSHTTYGTLCQDTAPAQNDKKLFENSEEYHAYLESKLDELCEKEPLKQEIRSMLELFGFGKEIPSMGDKLKKALNNLPITKVCEYISWISEKIKKKFRMKSFSALLFWVVKQGKTPISWMTKKANEFWDAIQDKFSMQGVDTSAIVDAIKHMEKQTGRKLRRKELITLLHYGTQHLLAALKLTVFKAKRLKLRDWVGFVHSVAQKSIMTMANMYKSEETLRKEREKENAEFARQKKIDEKSFWDDFLSDCDEEPILRDSPMREIWDCG